PLHTPPSPLRSGRSLFSRISRASVPSSIRSSLVITPMVLRPTHTHTHTHTHTPTPAHRHTTSHLHTHAPGVEYRHPLTYTHTHTHTHTHISHLPPLVLEAVLPLAVDHPDAVECSHDEQSPGYADAHRAHPRTHICC